MNKGLNLKKCSKCDTLIRILKKNDVEEQILCCGEEMEDMIANSVDAAYEKHVPIYERDDKDIIVRVNHVMESEHYIEWICFVGDNREEYAYFTPDCDEVIYRFSNVGEGILYSYCNKHGLWKEEVK